MKHSQIFIKEIQHFLRNLIISFKFYRILKYIKNVYKISIVCTHFSGHTLIFNTYYVFLEVRTLNQLAFNNYLV